MRDYYNIADGLQEEIKRNQELLCAYKEIGPAGNFAYTMVQADINNALKVILEGDLVGMIQAFETLKNNN